MNAIYQNVILCSASCMLLTGALLALVKATCELRDTKFTIAKNSVTIAVLLLSALNFLQIGIDPHGSENYQSGCWALAVSYVQALLFTMAVLVLIRPAEVTTAVVARHAAVVATLIRCTYHHPMVYHCGKTPKSQGIG